MKPSSFFSYTWKQLVAKIHSNFVKLSDNGFTKTEIRLYNELCFFFFFYKDRKNSYFR